ncbi:MAG TPA: TolC family protein [Vicinamibacterales bacterium]|nr:TolC family protein [Vicinamibacterales bacterium]
MRRALVLTIVASCALVASPARAQTRLTLSEAVRQATEGNPGILAAAAATDEARAHADAARAAWLPRVSFSESWQRSNQPVFVFSSLLAARAFTEADFATSRLNQPDAVSAFAGRFFVNQVVYDARTGATTALESARHAAARAALDERRATVALDVTRAYGRALAAAAAESAARGAADAARENVARAERRRDAGLATDADVLAFSVHAAAMERRRIAAAGEVLVAHAELNRLTGEPIDRTLGLEEPPPPPDHALEAAALIREAEAQRPELRRAAAERRAAEAGSRMARAGWLPRVTAQAGYQIEGLELVDRADSWLIGGEVTWSLSVGGAERARARAARAALAAADARAADTRAALQLDVVTAVVTANTARARLVTGRRTVEEAAERERITRNRYDAGLAGVIDVLAAASASLDAELERVAALVDALVAAAMLDRAVGRPVGTRLP